MHLYRFIFANASKKHYYLLDQNNSIIWAIPGEGLRNTLAKLMPENFRAVGKGKVLELLGKNESQFQVTFLEAPAFLKYEFFAKYYGG